MNTKNGRKKAPSVQGLQSSTDIRDLNATQDASGPDIPSEQIEPLQGEAEVIRFCDVMRYEHGASEHTIRNYKTDLMAYLRWAERYGLDPYHLTHRQLRRYLAELDSAGYARKTINRHLSAIKSLFSWLNTIGEIDSDPASALQGPKSTSKLPKAIRAQDMIAILQVHSAVDGEGRPRECKPEDYRDQAILELFYASGARVSEIANLKLGDVDLKKKMVKVFGKGSKERIIPIHSLACESLIGYLEHGRDALLNGKASDYLFVSSRGNKFSDQAIRKMFKETLMAANVDPSLSPHAMRHTFATDVLGGGADLRSVQEMLGHSSLSTTQIYTHVSPQRLKNAHHQAHPRA